MSGLSLSVVSFLIRGCRGGGERSHIRTRQPLKPLLQPKDLHGFVEGAVKGGMSMSTIHSRTGLMKRVQGASTEGGGGGRCSENVVPWAERPALGVSWR